MSFNFADILAAILAQQGGIPPAPGATPVPTPAAPPAPVAAPAAAATGDAFRRPFNMQGGGQDVGSGMLPFAPPSQAQPFAGPQSGVPYTDPRGTFDYDALMARNELLYKGDPTHALKLLNSGAPMDQLQKYFGPEALQAEVERIKNYPRYSGTQLDRFMSHTADYTPMLTMMALGGIGGAAFAPEAAAAGGAAGAVAPEVATAVGAEGMLYPAISESVITPTAAASGALPAGLVAGLGKAGTNIGLQAFMNGGDWRAALTNYGLGQGLEAGADFAAPYVNDAVVGAKNYDLGFDPKRGVQVADASGGVPIGMFDKQSLSGPASVIGPDGVVRSAQPNAFGGWAAPAAGQSFIGDPLNAINAGALTGAASMMPAAPETDPTFGGALKESQPGVYAPPSAPAVTSADLQRYVKIGQSLNTILGAHDGPPPPAADATPEEQAQYATDIVNYLGLDAQTMADAGLTPGSPEYTKYILDQADAIISQVMGDLDVNADDLAAQLRTKTDQELQQLQRALYVRGQLGTQASAGTYTDPFTGTSQEVVGPGMFDPNTAAYQRGLAGNVDQLGGLRGSQAYDYLQQLLGRDSDPFGMQAQQDQQFELAKLNDEAQRRRGMFSGSY